MKNTLTNRSRHQYWQCYKSVLMTTPGVRKKWVVRTMFLCWWAVKVTIYIHGVPPICKKTFQRICANPKRGLNRSGGSGPLHSPQWRRHWYYVAYQTTRYYKKWCSLHLFDDPKIITRPCSYKQNHLQNQLQLKISVCLCIVLLFQADSSDQNYLHSNWLTNYSRVFKFLCISGWCTFWLDETS